MIRIMLAVERILALYDTRVEGGVAFRCGRDKCVYHIEGGDGGKFNRGIFSGSALHADGGSGNHKVSTLHIHLHPATGTDADKGMRPCFDQFFQRNGGGRSADAGGGDAHLFTAQSAGISDKFSGISNIFGILQIFGYLRNPFRVSRQDDVFADLVLADLDVVLPGSIYRIMHSPLLSIRMNHKKYLALVGISAACCFRSISNGSFYLF